MITVHITDDHRILAEGLSALINDSHIATVTGVSYSLATCRNALAFRRPDVLLLDVRMPDGCGLDFCDEIKQKYPTLKVLALSSHNEYTMVYRMMESGANGYIFKDTVFEELLAGIETVMNGGKFLCEKAKLLLEEKFSRNQYLTDTERAILRLIAEGYKSKEIADELSLSVETIKSYRKNMILKFDMRIAAIVAMAIRKNWI